MSHPFYIVDVFAEKKYGGNQLAVIINDGVLDAQDMQQIALEMNYSETTFIQDAHQHNGGYNVRIFSLDEELPFAGHPTLGTAFIIQQVIVGAEVPEIRLNLPVGQIPVSISYSSGQPDLLTMKQVEPLFGQKLSAGEAAAAIGLNPKLVDRSFPVEEVSTGLPFIIIPLINLEAVRQSKVDIHAYQALIEKTEAKSLLIFSPETYLKENQVNCRMFDHYHGIPEDPATGSANGCLAAYLVRHQYFGSNEIRIRVEQGYEINRPSLLLLEAKEERGEFSIYVGGRCVQTARGELL